MHTPDIISELEDNEVFVFGSNTLGEHMGGAARVAYELFDAVWGQGEGLQGKSYAIPTMDGLELISNATRRFLDYAASVPELTFYVTKIGCGIAGHDEETISAFFSDASSNVILPEGWPIEYYFADNGTKWKWTDGAYHKQSWEDSWSSAPSVDRVEFDKWIEWGDIA